MDKENIELICYGRDDLMSIAEKIAVELGDIDIAEALCDKMATAAYEFSLDLMNGGIYTVTRY